IVTILTVTLQIVRNGARDGAHSSHPCVDLRQRPGDQRPDPWPFAGAGPRLRGTGDARANFGPFPTPRSPTTAATPPTPTPSPHPGQGAAASPEEMDMTPPPHPPATAGVRRTAPGVASSRTPGYAPVPPSALGPALNADGYFAGSIDDTLHWVTDSFYQAMF